MNNKGFGLLGMLVSAVIIGILMSLVLKQYAGQTRRVLEMPGLTAPQQADPSVKAVRGQKGSGRPKSGAQPATTAAPKCNGRLVGNICVPTEIRSSSLDAFEGLE